MWHPDGMPIWMFGMGMITNLIFWAVLIGGGVLLYHFLRDRGPSGPGPGNSAERLLAERYARGEIDDEEYRKRLETLRGTR